MFVFFRQPFNGLQHWECSLRIICKPCWNLWDQAWLIIWIRRSTLQLPKRCIYLGKIWRSTFHLWRSNCGRDRRMTSLLPLKLQTQRKYRYSHWPPHRFCPQLLVNFAGGSCEEWITHGTTAELTLAIWGMQRTPTAKIQVYICWFTHILRYKIY